MTSDCLFGNLELSGLNDLSVAIPQLNNVDAAIKFIQIESGFWRNIFLLINHFAKKIKNLDVITLLSTFFQFKSNERSGRIRIELNDPVSSILRESS